MKKITANVSYSIKGSLSFYTMELLSSEELRVVRQYKDEFKSMTAYILAIKELSHLVDSCLDGCEEAIELFNQVKAAHIPAGIDINSLFFRLKSLANFNQDLLDARNNLFLRLSAAQTKWVNNMEYMMEHDDTWFDQTTERIRELIVMYGPKFGEVMLLLQDLRSLEAQIWLDTTHYELLLRTAGH